MKKNKIIFIAVLLLILNIKTVKAWDSGVAGGSDAEIITDEIVVTDGAIINFDSLPTLRVTAVDKNGNKIGNSMEFYTTNLQDLILNEVGKAKTIYYKGYKFNKNNSTLSSKKDDFFGLETTDNYEIVYEKIKYTLEHKEENEIIDFLQNNLSIQKQTILQHIKDKDLFLVIEPVFKIYDGNNYVIGTSSEVINHLRNQPYIYNLHYRGTLELMGKGLLMYEEELKTIKQKEFKKEIYAASKTSFTGWYDEDAEKVQSESYSYGMVMFYVGDFIIIEDDAYSCVSTTNICSTNTNIDINGISSSYYTDKNGTIDTAEKVSNATCIYQNPKYKFGETNAYCSAKITSSTANILNKLKSVKLGRFIGMTSTPSLTISWICYSEKEEYAKDAISLINTYKMPNIEYDYLGKNYVYKNTGIKNYYNTTLKGKTHYGSEFYSYVSVLKYDYSYETQYLNKWVDKETGKGSGNSSFKPIDGNEYSVNPKNINFEIPNDKKILGENEINIIYDTTSVLNPASSYFTKYNNSNGKIEISTNGKTITFFNTNTSSKNNKENFNCPSKINVEDRLIVPEDIIYRPIDLSDPFPGKDGSGRETGTNWNEYNIKTYITERQDVYTKTPLYSVTLTPSIIKEIRKYNKQNSYGDNSTLTCDESGQHCYSTFLRDTKFSNMIDQNKSLCYNINNTTSSGFDDCVNYSNRK